MADYINLPCRPDPGQILVVVESARGSSFKMKYDPSKNVFVFHRALALGVAYPYDWGFVPSTRAEDGDPLDAMVIFDMPTTTGAVIPAKPIGVVQMSQTERGPSFRNDRVIAVPIDDPREHIDELSKRTKEELEDFFEVMARMKKAKVDVLGWKGPKTANEAVEAAAARYISGSK